MQLREIGLDDPDYPALLEQFVDVANAVRRADSPWEHPMTPREADGLLRRGWDLEPDVGLLAVADGSVVGLAQYSTSEWDNRHLAWLSLRVHPEHRRRGHGTAILQALVGRARSEGRTSVGTHGWDAPAPIGFAARHGLLERAREVNRRQVLADLDRAELDRLYDEARPHAAAYELVRLHGPVPDGELEAYAAMVAAINDAPTDDLDVEDEDYPPERVRAYERAQAESGVLLHRVYARHRETGALAGQTVVAIPTERPHLAEQHDTSVVAAHRGHRLGLLLKLELLRWLADDQPQVVSIDTWNAESNDQMIGVNRTLGYHVLGRVRAFQMSI